MDTLVPDLLRLVNNHLDGFQTTLVRFDNYDGFEVDDPKWFLYYLRKKVHWLVIRDCNDENVLKSIRDYCYNEGSYEADNINRRLLILKAGRCRIDNVAHYTLKYNEHGLMDFCTLTKALCAAIKNLRFDNIGLLKPIFIKHAQMYFSDDRGNSTCPCYEHFGIPIVMYPYIEAYKTCKHEIINLFPPKLDNDLSIYFLVGLAKHPARYDKEINTILERFNKLSFEYYSSIALIARKFVADQNIQGIKLSQRFYPNSSLHECVNFIYNNLRDKFKLSSLFIADDLEVLDVIPNESLKILYIRAMHHKRYSVCDRILRRFNLSVVNNSEREYKKKIAKIFTNSVFNEVGDKALDMYDYKLFKYVKGLRWI